MGETKKKESKMSDVDEHITSRYELKRRLGKGVRLGYAIAFISG